MEDLKERYKDIVLDYCNTFAKRHGRTFYEEEQSTFWLQDSVVSLDDLFIDLNDIRYDVDNNVEEGMFIKWYDKMSDCYCLDINCPNYAAFCKGAPIISDEELNNLKDQRLKIDDMMRDFKQQIEDINNKNK